MNNLFVFLSILFLFVSCEKHDEHDHTGEEGLEPLVYTLYSDDLELFVEFSPLIVGEPVTFLSHFTLINNFKPVINGKLTISLSKDEVVKVDKPDSPGIFKPQLIPQKAGTYNLVFRIVTGEINEEFIIKDIIVFPDEHTAEEKYVAEHDHEGISFLKEEAWKIDFSHIQVRKQIFYNILKTSGEILPAKGDEIIITAKHSGIVIFAKNDFFAGNPVRVKEPLFNISSGDLLDHNIAEEYLQAKATFEKRESDFERAKILIKDKLISNKEYLENKLAFDNAQVAYNTLAKNYVRGGKQVESPVKGFVKSIKVNEGQYVEIGQTLAVIAQNKKLIIKAEVSQNNIPELRTITSANFRTPYDNKMYDIKDIDGRLISYGKSTDKTSFYTPVYFEIDNKGDLMSGTFIEIYLKGSPISDALVIPATSVMEERGTYFVYVQTCGETFEKREITPGLSDGLNVQILAGIEEGERIVTSGAYRIKLASMSNVLPDHGHVH